MVLLHLIEIAAWALCYVRGDAMPDLPSALYFSAVTYTTTGYGRSSCCRRRGGWSAAVEALTGILMCGLVDRPLLRCCQPAMFGSHRKSTSGRMILTWQALLIRDSAGNPLLWLLAFVPGVFVAAKVTGARGPRTTCGSPCLRCWRSCRWPRCLVMPPIRRRKDRRHGWRPVDRHAGKPDRDGHCDTALHAGSTFS